MMEWLKYKVFIFLLIIILGEFIFFKVLSLLFGMKGFIKVVICVVGFLK